MNYVVTLTASASKDVEIEADSPEEAVQKAEDAHAKFDINEGRADSVSLMSGPLTDDARDELDAWVMVGRCELCLKILLDPIPQTERARTYVADDEGYYSCRPCYEAALARLPKRSG